MILDNTLEYYGDTTRWFVGTVINIHDPEQLGRIQVRIFGIHPDNTELTSHDDLPWASVASPITEGGSSGIGANTGIKPRAQVFGIFLDGKHSQVPLILGSIPKYEKERAGDAVREYEEEQQKVEDKSITSVDEQKLVGATNIEKAFNFFISEEGGSFSPEQACGIIGNYHVENGVNLRNEKDFDPSAKAVEKDGAEAFGLAQWNNADRAANRKGGPSRLHELQIFSREIGVDYRTMYAQLAYTKYELFKYKRLFRLADLYKADTPEDASYVFEKYYERPAPGSTEERQNEARKYYERLT
jgi:hypothetical protein